MRSLLILLLAGLVCQASPTIDQHAAKLAALIDPVKLATLGERAANPRIQKAVAILADAKSQKISPGAVCNAAIKQVRMKPAAGEVTKAALLRNLDIAGKARLPRRGRARRNAARQLAQFADYLRTQPR